MIISQLEKLHYEELHDLYSTPDNIRLIKSRVMSLVDRVAKVRIRETHKVPLWRNTYSAFVEKPEAKSLLERRRRR